MNQDIKIQQKTFLGNWDDLTQFLALANSPVRSELREKALHNWENYKLARQRQGNTSGKKGSVVAKKGLWGKGDYIRSLTSKMIDLKGIHAKNICIGYADFRGVNFDNAVFDVDDSKGWISMKGAKLQNASLRNAILHSARLMGADLSYSDLTGVKLINADLEGANLQGATLCGANLMGANLQYANLVGAKLQGANLSGSRVYGVAAWDIEIDDNTNLRRDLIVTPFDQPEIKVDSIEVAQFVYLLLNNTKIRDVLETVCKKGVLILGRFTKKRKKILEAMKAKARELGYLPILFDFDKPADKDFTETLITLAGMCNFIIADITNPKSSPLELKASMPIFGIPFVPIIQKNQEPFSMFADLQNEFGKQNKGKMIDLLTYDSEEDLIRVFKKAIIDPAVALSRVLNAPKGRPVRTRSTSDY